MLPGRTALGKHPAYLLMRDPGARADLAQAPPLTPRVRHRRHQRRTGHLFQHRAQLRQPAQPYRRRQVGDLPTKTINIGAQERHTLCDIKPGSPFHSSWQAGFPDGQALQRAVELQMADGYAEALDRLGGLLDGPQPTKEK